MGQNILEDSSPLKTQLNQPAAVFLVVWDPSINKL